MFRKLIMVLFATQFALATCARCQSIQPMPSEILPSEIPPDSVLEHFPPVHIEQHPFVSGHSLVPYTTRTRFETVGDCGPCSCQHHPCVCGDKKSQRKAKLQYKYWGYPELFCERPHGSFLRSILDAQIAKGMAGQMILYRYDFFDIDQPQANALKPAGFRSVSKIVELASISPTPIMIETTGDAAFDAARRVTVINALSQMSFSVAEDQVVTIDHDPFGMSADEAILSHGKMLQQSSSQSSGNSQGTGIAVPIFPLFGE